MGVISCWSHGKKPRGCIPGKALVCFGLRPRYQAGRLGRTHLAIGLMAPAPARVAHDVDVGREAVEHPAHCQRSSGPRDKAQTSSVVVSARAPCHTSRTAQQAKAALLPP